MKKKRCLVWLFSPRQTLASGSNPFVLIIFFRLVNIIWGASYLSQHNPYRFIFPRALTGFLPCPLKHCGPLEAETLFALVGKEREGFLNYTERQAMLPRGNGAGAQRNAEASSGFLGLINQKWMGLSWSPPSSRQQCAMEPVLKPWWERVSEGTLSPARGYQITETDPKTTDPREHRPRMRESFGSGAELTSEKEISLCVDGLCHSFFFFKIIYLILFYGY